MVTPGEALMQLKIVLYVEPKKKGFVSTVIKKVTLTADPLL